MGNTVIWLNRKRPELKLICHDVHVYAWNFQVSFKLKDLLERSSDLSNSGEFKQQAASEIAI